MDNRLVALFAVFAPLSLLSFGGGQAIVADIQHQTVDVYGFLSNQEFADLFAISRAAPGPSTL
ncbi:MAG TPA: chromate transporter, partial [Beijerinckiaceae bacterium]|nr:chromate transporter [Beijerinckiaceae bacterium]